MEDRIVSNLKKYREERHLSHKELSDTTGISIRCLKYYEKLVNTPSILNAYRLALCLKVPVEELFAYESLDEPELIDK